MTSPYTALSSEVETALTLLNSDSSSYQPQTATELFKLEDQVQIFFLTQDGKVSTFSAPETLRVLQFKDSGNVFLQVGGWTQPLVPGSSPCLQAENGAIMFPDIYSENTTCSVGLVLVDQVGEQQRAQLLELLQQHTALVTQPLLPPEDRLGTVGSTILKGAELLSQGIEKGAEKAGELIEYVAEKGQEKLAKGEEEAKVGSLTKHSINAAKTATTATVKVSGYVANRVGDLTKSIATSLAGMVVKPTDGNAVSKNKGGAKAVLVDAARGSLAAYGTVYNGLETSAKVLGKNVKGNSVKVVQHKYGLQAADAFGDACTAAGNAAMTYMNIQSLGAKGLVKKTAKETGKNVVKNALNVKDKKSVTSEVKN